MRGLLRNCLIFGGGIVASEQTDYISSLPFDVLLASPRSLFASKPAQAKCADGLAATLSTCLGMDEGTLMAGLTKFINALLKKKSGMEEVMDVYENKLALREKLHKDPRHYTLSAHNRIAALADTFNHFSPLIINETTSKGSEQCSDPSTCHMPQLSDGAGVKLDLGEFRLDYLPDLFLGFLSSNSVSRVFGDAFGQSTPDWLGTGLNIKSPMKNLGTTICQGSDSAFRNDFDENWSTCGIITLLTLGLGCGDVPVDCSNLPTKSTVYDPDSCDRFASAKSPVNLNLTADGYGGNLVVTDELRGAEGEVWLYRWIATERAYEWGALHALCGGPPPHKEMVPGWPVVMEVWSQIQGSAALDNVAVPGTIPQLTVAQRDLYEGEDETTCEFLLTFRGTAIAPEWKINFTAGQSVIAGACEQCMAHNGYNELSAAIIPRMSQWLDRTKFETGKCDLKKTTFHLTGHSLGGGLAELAALKVAGRYQPLGATIDLVTFAASHALNVAATEQLTQMVNVRSLVAELDIIPQFPCVNNHGLPRCDWRKCAGLAGDGRTETFAPHPNPVPITKEKLGSYSWPLVDAAGNPLVDDQGKAVVFSSQVLYNNDTLLTWGLSNLQNPAINLPSPLQMGANHNCAYECYLTAEFCQTDPSKSSMCDCHTLPPPPPAPAPTTTTSTSTSTTNSTTTSTTTTPKKHKASDLLESSEEHAE